MIYLPSYENTVYFLLYLLKIYINLIKKVLFFFTCYQYLTSIAALYKGLPFREPVFKNKYFCA